MSRQIKASAAKISVSFTVMVRLCCLIQSEDMPVPLCLILKQHTEFQAYQVL